MELAEIRERVAECNFFVLHLVCDREGIGSVVRSFTLTVGKVCARSRLRVIFGEMRRTFVSHAALRGDVSVRKLFDVYLFDYFIRRTFDCLIFFYTHVITFI